MNGNRSILTAIAGLALLSLSVDAFGADESPKPESRLEEVVGVLVDGGEWRTPNPEYAGGVNQPSHFALRYRWGPGRTQAISELVGIFPNSPETPVYWTIYTYLNPATGAVEVLQIGAGGAVAKGHMTIGAEGQRLVEQSFTTPDGNSRDVRHVEVFDPSGEEFRSEVFERDGRGNWTRMRDWTWMRVDRP